MPQTPERFERPWCWGVESQTYNHIEVHRLPLILVPGGRRGYWLNCYMQIRVRKHPKKDNHLKASISFKGASNGVIFCKDRVFKGDINNVHEIAEMIGRVILTAAWVARAPHPNRVIWSGKGDALITGVETQRWRRDNMDGTWEAHEDRYYLVRPLQPTEAR